MKKLSKYKNYIYLTGLCLALVFYISSSGLSWFLQAETTKIVEAKNYVYVAGAVQNEGVYEYEDGELLIDVINRAGGFSGDADMNFVRSNLDLSERVNLKTKINIPFVSNSFTEGESSNASNSDLSAKFNGLTDAEILEIEGIGEKTLEKIKEIKPINDINELKSVDGIGDKTLEKINDYLAKN